MPGIADALGSLVDPPKRPAVSASGRSAARTSRRSDAETPKRPELALQGTAKSRHPDFVKKTLYLRKSTVRDAFRRYQDEYEGKEESEMVEMLLREYAHGGNK